MIQIEKNGQVVRQSQNLRGLFEYARQEGVSRIELIKLPDNAGSMRVFFKDGAVTRANFASYSVMHELIKKQKHLKTCENLIEYSK